MRKTSFSKLGLLFGLYMSQGIPHGFFFLAAPVILRERGLSLPEIGLTTILSLPWLVKFATAPFIDRVAIPGLGHRRGWILITQATTIACMLFLAFVPEETHIKVILYTMFLMNLASSTQDIATDGYAVATLADHERGWGNGIQLGGYFTGTLFGGGLTLILLQRLSWTGIFLALSAMLVVAVFPVIIKRFQDTPQPSSQQDDLHTHKGWVQTLGQFFKRKGVLVLLSLIILYRLPGGFTQMMLTTYIVDVGFSQGEIGQLISIGTIASVIGAAFGGFFSTKMDRRKSMLCFAFIRMLVLAYLTGLAYFKTTDHNLILIGLIADKLAYSMAIVALFAFMMDQSNPAQGSTDYTLQDSFGVFSIMFAAGLSGYLSQIDYTVNFGVGLCFGILAIVAVWFLFPKATQGQPQSQKSQS